MKALARDVKAGDIYRHPDGQDVLVFRPLRMCSHPDHGHGPDQIMGLSFGRAARFLELPENTPIEITERADGTRLVKRTEEIKNV